MKSRPPHACVSSCWSNVTPAAMYLGVQRVDVFDLDEGIDESLSVFHADREDRLVDELEMHARPVARHRAIEGRFAV